MYLVDTNVISAAAPNKHGAPAALVDWMDSHADTLFLSVVTIAEVVAGIAKARREGATHKADALSGWLDLVVHLHADRILPMDVAVAYRAGEISDRVRGMGYDPGHGDIVIGATADAHGLTLLTRNLRDFMPMNIRLHDPFDSLPAEVA